MTDGFKVRGARDLLAQVESVNDFRNTYVAHHEKDLTDRQLAEDSLKLWVECLASVHGFS